MAGSAGGRGSSFADHWFAPCALAGCVWLGVFTLPWEGGIARAGAAAAGILVSVVAWQWERHAGKDGGGVLAFGITGGVVGMIAAGALLFVLPGVFSEHETRPIDAVLGGLILGGCALGLVVGGLIARRGR